MENVDLRCVCGARWNGGPLPAPVASRFRVFFEEEHAGHTERDPDAPTDDEDDEEPA